MEGLVWRKVKPLVAVRGSRRSARHSIGHRTGRETTEGDGGTSRGLCLPTQISYRLFEC